MPPIGSRGWPFKTRQEEIIWLAAYLDGEGTFLPRRIVGARRTCHSPCIQVTSTDKDLSERAAKITGGRMYLQQLSVKNPKWKDAWQVTISGTKAVELMRLILPYMGIRRSQKIREILSSDEAYISRNHIGQTHCPKGHLYVMVAGYGGSRIKGCAICRAATARAYRLRRKSRDQAKD